MGKIAICDDDIRILEGFSEIIQEKYKGKFEITRHLSPFFLEQYVIDEQKGNVDIIILDIQLGEENGIEVARKIQKEYPNIGMILLTGYLEYARDIFRADPSYFLVKPVKREELFAAIDKCLKLQPIRESRELCIEVKGSVIRLPIQDIYYMESEKRRIHIYGETGHQECYGKLGDFMERLTEQFVRCHQSYIVNMDKIQKMEMEEILLINGEKIPVSRAKYSEVRERFIQYLKDKM